MRSLARFRLLLVTLSPAVAQKAEVTIDSIRLAPWTLPANGKAAQMVMIDWKNTGKTERGQSGSRRWHRGCSDE